MKKLLSVSFCAVAFLGSAQAATILTGGVGDTPLTLTSANGAAPAPTIEPTGGNPGGHLLLTEAANGLQNLATFDRSDAGVYERSTFTFQFRIEQVATPTADGFSFSYLPTSLFGTTGAGPTLGEDPASPGVLGFGFDTWSNGAPFDTPGIPTGSDYNDISLFYDNALVQRIDDTRLLTPALTLDDGMYHTAAGTVNFSLATVSLTVDNNPIFTNVPVPGLTPFESRIGFGARTGGENERLSIDNVDVRFVPEPGVATLGLLGLGLLARRRRR